MYCRERVNVSANLCGRSSVLTGGKTSRPRGLDPGTCFVSAPRIPLRCCFSLSFSRHKCLWVCWHQRRRRVQSSCKLRSLTQVCGISGDLKTQMFGKMIALGTSRIGTEQGDEDAILEYANLLRILRWRNRHTSYNSVALDCPSAVRLEVLFGSKYGLSPIPTARFPNLGP